MMCHYTNFDDDHEVLSLNYSVFIKGFVIQNSLTDSSEV